MLNTPDYAAVAEHLRKLHEPAFGRPHALRELEVTRDGSQIAMTGAVLDDLSGLPRTAIYTCSGGELHPLTTASGSARWARFAPDGSTLAFLSDRRDAGVFQLQVLTDATAEAVAARAVPGTVEYAHWSPSGRQVLLGVAALGADLSGAQGSGATATQSPSDLPEWSPIVDTGVSETEWRSLWLYDVESDEVERLSPEGMNCWEANWCGAEQVVAITSEDPREDAWYDAVLTLLDVDGRGSRELFRSKSQLALPAGSPDGRHAAVVEAICSDRGVVAGDMVLVNVVTGTSTALDTRNTDVTRLQWIDPTQLGYFGQRRLDSVAGIVDVTTGHSRELFSTTRACGGAFYPDGVFTSEGAVLTIQESYDVPPQVVCSATGQPDLMLASVAHAGTTYLSSVAGQAQPISWTAPDGLEIEGIVCTPPGEGPHPLVVNIHGGPVWAFRETWGMTYSWVPLLVSRGYAVLNPNPRGSGGRGQEFARRVVGDMGGADTYDILSGVDALVDRGIADPTRIGLIGGSYGGFMSSWLVTQDRRFAAAVPVSPVTDWYSQSFTSNIARWGQAFLGADPEQPGTHAHTRSPVLHASKARTACLNVAGAKDRCTPPAQAQEFHQALLMHGVESALVIYPEEGHGVRALPALTDFLTRAVGWFETHMPADGTRTGEAS